MLWKTSLLCLLVLFVPSRSSAQETRYSFSGFYTFANFSKIRTSSEYDAYATLSFRNRHFLTAGYLDVSIHDDAWDYRQKMGLVGGSFLVHGVWTKVYYSRIEGKYLDPLTSWSYKDQTHVGSMEGMVPLRAWNFGLEYTQLGGTGYYHTVVRQYTARVGRLCGPRVYLSLRPNYVWLNDDRRLFSVSGSLDLPIDPTWKIRFGGMIGERAYYFDNDLLTINNQNETQQNVFFCRSDWVVANHWSLSAEYLRTQFTLYNIDYYVVGLMRNF